MANRQSAEAVVHCGECVIHPTHLNLRHVHPEGIRFRPCVPGRTNAQGGAWSEWVDMEDDPPEVARWYSTQHGGYQYEVCLRSALQVMLLAERHGCEVKLRFGDEEVDGRGMGVRMLLYYTERTARPPASPPVFAVEIRCTGDETAAECLTALIVLLESPFEEFAPGKS